MPFPIHLTPTGKSTSSELPLPAAAPRTTGGRCSAGRHGRSTSRAASTTSICSRRSSPTSTGATPRCTSTSTRSCASGSTGGWTAFGSTWPTASTRTSSFVTIRNAGAGCRGPSTRTSRRPTPGINPKSTRSIECGGSWPTPIPVTVSSSARYSSWTRPGWPPICVRASCTSTSTSFS